MFRLWEWITLVAALFVVWDSNPGYSQTQTAVVSDAPQSNASPAASTPPTSTDPSDPSAAQRMHLQLMQTLEQLTPYRHTEKLTGKIVLVGSTTMSDLGHQWAHNFKQFHPEVEFSGTMEGSEAALELLSSDPTLIAGVSRPVDGNDQKILERGKCKEPIAITVGMEAMALFVHKSNPIESVTPEIVKRIFAASSEPTSKNKVWGDVGVEGELAKEPIVIYERGANSGSQTFISRVLLSGAEIDATFRPCETNTQICTSIAGDSNGVGFADIRYEHPDIRRVPLLVQGQVVQANEFNVLAGKYPIVRPLMLVLDKAQLASDGKLRESWLRYVLSRDGQSIVMKSGFFPLDPGFIHHQVNELFGEQIR